MQPLRAAQRPEHQKERQAQQMPPQKVAQKPEPLLMQVLTLVHQRVKPAQ